jgi:fluoride ion exporter CrcB/FEX
VTGATLLVVLATLAAGALGAVVRAAAVARAPRAGTTVVNLAGTLLLALVLVAHGRGAVGGGVAVVVGVGLSGSLTTFSGWIALLVARIEQRPSAVVPTVVLDLLLPLLAGVAITVLVFATLAGSA